MLAVLFCTQGPTNGMSICNVQFLYHKFLCIFMFIPKALNGEGGDSLEPGTSPHPANETGALAEPEDRKDTPLENGAASKQEVTSGDRLESRWI